MVALNRLTGHSKGFFSVYTLPPNQATSVTAQRRINARRDQTPPHRDVTDLIRRKSRSLLTDCDAATRCILDSVSASARLIVGSAASTPELADGSVDLVITSPPFPDVVNYAGDNWPRCWFCDIDPASVPISLLHKLEQWEVRHRRLPRTAPGAAPGRPRRVRGRRGAQRPGASLEESVVACALAAGLTPLLMILVTPRSSPRPPTAGACRTTAWDEHEPGSVLLQKTLTDPRRVRAGDTSSRSVRGQKQ